MKNLKQQRRFITKNEEKKNEVRSFEYRTQPLTEN